MQPRQPSRQNSVNSPCQPLHSVPICRTRSTGGSGSSMKVWARQLNFSGRCRSLAGAFLKTFVKNLILRYQVLLSNSHNLILFFLGAAYELNSMILPLSSFTLWGIKSFFFDKAADGIHSVTLSIYLKHFAAEFRAEQLRWNANENHSLNMFQHSFQHLPLTSPTSFPSTCACCAGSTATIFEARDF